MLYLDCHNLETTLTSIAGAIGVRVDKLAWLPDPGDLTRPNAWATGNEGLIGAPHLYRRDGAPSSIARRMMRPSPSYPRRRIFTRVQKTCCPTQLQPVTNVSWFAS
jgi:hypothetical protein